MAWRWWVRRVWRPRPLHLLTAVALLATADAQVCELELIPNSSVQSLMDIECNVTFLECTCSSKFFVNKSWLLTSVAANLSHLSADPGYWYPTDGSGRCVQWPSKPLLCPPGFFCSGGLQAPRACFSGDHCIGGATELGRRCPEHYFCHTPAGPMFECYDGCQCPEGTSSPHPCMGGKLCKGGEVRDCPKGHYCPFASAVPKKCHILAFCPEGSAAENLYLLGAIFVVLASLAFYTAARVYKEIVTNGNVAVSVVGVLIVAVYIIMDAVIGSFLALVYVTVAVNWGLLKLGPCPPVIASLLFMLTLAVADILIFLVNPSWAVLASAFILFFLIGWLMARGNSLAGLGRLIFLVAFGLLMVVYWRVDFAFTALCTTVMCLTGVSLALFWIWDQHRQHRTIPFPVTVWNEPTHNFGEADWDGAEGGGSGSQIRPAEGSGTSHSFLADSAFGSGVSGVSDISAGGVSFSLKEVSFELPDGLKLLQKVDLRIGAGRSVAVMGPSGCGKSTLLSVLSGRSSSGVVTGELIVNGQRAADLSFLKRVTGFVPQDDVLHGELLVEENIRFQALLRLPPNLPRDLIEERVQRVAKDLRLVDLLQKRVGTPEQRGVSGGQRKRVSIAMELVAAPCLLFADEPTSGLDSSTSHEVVGCLTQASGQMTVIAVIHQPRYDTLCLFDDLVLLGKGGFAVYGGRTERAMDYFKRQLHIEFPVNSNPADTFLDILTNHPVLTPQDCAYTWSACMASVSAASTAEEAPSLYRQPQPFVRAVLLNMDRSLRTTLQSRQALFINQGLNTAATVILCTVIKYDKLDQFIMQSAFACLFLMLLQGVAAQRIFGADLIVTWREAQVGMPMIAFFVAKDLAALFELTLSAVVFTVTYSCFSGAGISLKHLLGGSWAFLYVVFGLSYIFSMVLSPGSSQMAAVVASFVSFCVSGVYQPQLPDFVQMLGGRGWMIPALSPIRWIWAYMLTQEVQTVSTLTRQGAKGSLANKGYNLDMLEQCEARYSGSAATLSQAWRQGQGWVCSVADMILLGVIFRFVAGFVFILTVNATTSGWARFFGESNTGAWRLAGILFKVLVSSFVVLFLVAEVWLFGILDAKMVFSQLAAAI